MAVDKLELHGVDALRARGVTLVDGQAITETARLIKSAEEIELMRWSIRVCEAGMARIYENSLPGKTENELYAELHQRSPLIVGSRDDVREAERALMAES